MDWYATIKRYYDRKLWTISMVGDAVYLGKITEEQYTVITGIPYVEGPAPYSEGATL